MMSHNALLKVLPSVTTIPTKLYESSEAIPYEIADRFDFESDVSLEQLGNSFYCLNNPLRVEQIYGGEKLKVAWQQISQGRIQELPHEDRTLLLQRRFIVSPGEDKRKYHRQLMKAEEVRTDDRPSFTLLRILLTDICNLNCNYCKVIPNIDLPQKLPLSSERLEEVIQFYFAHSEEHRPKIIHITGGEPTIFFDRVKEIIEARYRYQRPNENVWIVLGTNAILIDQERADYLAKHDVKCIVSMDGPEEVHNTLRKNWAGKGSWREVDRGIRRLKNAGAEVSLSMVIGQHTIDSVNHTIEWFLDEYRPSGLGVNFMKPPTPSQQDYPYLVDEKLYADTLYGVHKRFRDRGLFLELVFRKLQPFVQQRYRYHDCGAANGTNLNIDAKGSIGPCKSFLIMKKLAINTLSGEGYKESVIKKWRARSPVYYQYCDKCPARGVCGNGCAYDAFVHSGEEMAIDARSCNYTKRFNRLFLEDLGEICLRDRQAEFKRGLLVTPSPEDRNKVLGEVRARPMTLSYSIGHQTMD